MQTPYLFTGKELDVATGLYYFGARYYDPHLGIWSSPDPLLVRYIGRPSNDGAWDPHALAVFSYAHNSPLRFIDPQGLQNLAAAGVGSGVGTGIAEVSYLWSHRNGGFTVRGLLTAMAKGSFEGAAWGFNPALGAGVSISMHVKDEKDLGKAGLIIIASRVLGGNKTPEAGAPEPPPEVQAAPKDPTPNFEEAIAAARETCAGGDCAQLAQALVPHVPGGKVITILPKSTPELETMPGLFAKPVGFHKGVLTPQGNVIDPFIGVTYQTPEAFIAATVKPGSANFQVMVEGQVVQVPK